MQINKDYTHFVLIASASCRSVTYISTYEIITWSEVSGLLHDVYGIRARCVVDPATARYEELWNCAEVLTDQR